MDLKGFDLEHWWKLLAAAGALTLAGAAAARYAPGAPIGLSLIAIGVGEWINHPLQTHVVTLRYQVTSHNRLAHLSGGLLDLAGAALLAIGLIKLLIA